MKKIELKNLAEYFGNKIPAGRIKDKDIRLSIVRLYASIASAYKGVADEIESIRLSLVGDKSEEIAKFGELQMRSMDKRLTEEERAEAKKEADTMTECIRINDDFREAAKKVYEENIDVDVKKVSLEVLYEALFDCGFPGMNPDTPLNVVANEFSPVIMED